MIPPSSRSSRLFIVLLHLMGVSTNLPLHVAWNIGIVGVKPMAILLERLDLESVGGLEGLLNKNHIKNKNGEQNTGSQIKNKKQQQKQQQEEDQHYQQERHPYWLQDDYDGTCLGPMGFSDCGDTTVWLLRRKNLRSVKKKKGFWSALMRSSSSSARKRKSEPQWGYALELVQSEWRTMGEYLKAKNHLNSNSSNIIKPRQQEEEEDSERECLALGLSSRHRQRRKRKSAASSLPRQPSLTVAPCSLAQAWNWRMNGDGVLFQDLSFSSTKVQGRRKRLLEGTIVHALESYTNKNIDDKDEVGLDNSRVNCVSRINGTAVAVATECTSDDTQVDAINAQEKKHGDEKRIVEFSLVRYRAADLSTTTIPDEASVSSSARDEESLATTELPSANNEVLPKEPHHLPTTMRSSQSHATGHSHSELKPPSEMLHRTLGSSNKLARTVLQDSHPMGYVDDFPLGGRKSGSIVGGKASRTMVVGQQQQQHQNIKLHLEAGVRHETLHRPRKMPVHPYIESSKNDIWTDPATGLEFPTDLTDYLERDRKTTGRHTLVGVGTYTKFIVKLKVYSIAMYVKKRDVLADPEFEKYAGFNADELRNNLDFYNHLMHNPSQNNPNAGRYERTLMLKLNMQLSIDTMRSCLDADWKLLNQHLKDIVINSSLKERPADANMLAKIQSPENTSRCSCGQVAPPEYNADPSCCARGTALSFTWLPNGYCEARLDGRVMDIFPEEGLGSGIFYEYLRADDPMSVEARNNFADGFPFLLAPLAQVKGVNMATTHAVEEQQQSRKERDHNQKAGGGAGGLRMILGAPAFMASQVTGAVGWAQDRAHGMASNVAGAAKNAVKAARNLGEEMEQRRVTMWDQMLMIPQESIGFFVDRVDFFRREKGPFSTQSSLSVSIDGSSSSIRRAMRRNASGEETTILLPPTPLERSSSDQITRLFFLGMVHLYLMLLLIVSIPGSYSIRTKLVLSGRNKTRNAMKGLKGIPNSSWQTPHSLHHLEYEINYVERRNRTQQESFKTSEQEVMRKSLSYYL